MWTATLRHEEFIRDTELSVETNQVIAGLHLSAPLSIRSIRCTIRFLWRCVSVYGLNECGDKVLHKLFFLFGGDLQRKAKD